MPKNPLGKFVRLYRAEGRPSKTKAKIPDWIRESENFKNNMNASGRWFTNDLEEALWYLANEYPGGIIKYVDIPADQVDQYSVSGKSKDKSTPNNPSAFSLRPEKEFYLSREAAGKAKIFKRR